jgi:hypothetical protein
MLPWLGAYHAALSEEPKVWGLHNYHDTTHQVADGLESFLHAVAGQVWLTETGGIVELRNGRGRVTHPYDEQRAANGVEYAFALARAHAARVRRIYIYNWQDDPNGYFTSGLLAASGRARPGFFMFADELARLAAQRARRVTVITAPDASIVVPVNAQGDLENVLTLLDDLGRYAGPHEFETVLVVNNFAQERRPPEIATLEALDGVRVLAVPSVREPGVAVALSARIAGMREAATPYAIHLDADCRVPDPTSLLDWYVHRLHCGDGVAYTRVRYYGVRRRPSIYARIGIHHAARWSKRVLLRIPTRAAAATRSMSPCSCGSRPRVSWPTR